MTMLQDKIFLFLSPKGRLHKKLVRLKYRLIRLMTDKKSNFFAALTPFNNLCKFLHSYWEIDECTIYLQENGYVFHEIDAKNWDIAHVIFNLSDGNFLDMGSSDSYILKNTIIKNIKGEKYGIDLRDPSTIVPGINYVVGDLTNTGLKDSFFKNITCLSVLEHEVDYEKFSSEVSRILHSKGKLYLTFDYWNPPIKSNIKLYGLDWQPLSQDNVNTLIAILKKYGLCLIQEVDWKTNETIITPENHSPDSTVSYTFGLLVFEKSI
ncbi:methyltransferase domain-containing protein [Synechocystis salina LEGE 06155]|nr:methyltransferase domain-containing protein [Synechocystis salina LEGE 06155]